jgi:hypothetical protein
MYGHHILNYFYLIEVYMISLKLNIINYFEKITNFENFEHMKYTCDKIIFVTKFKILNIYFKTKVVDGILG